MVAAATLAVHLQSSRYSLEVQVQFKGTTEKIGDEWQE